MGGGFVVDSLFISMLPNAGSADHHLKANTLEASVVWKEKVALFRRPATWEEGNLCPEANYKDPAGP